MVPPRPRGPRAPDAVCELAFCPTEWERLTLPEATVSPLGFLKIKVDFWCQYAAYIFVCLFFKLW